MCYLNPQLSVFPPKRQKKIVYKNAVDTNTIFDLVHLLLQNV